MGSKTLFLFYLTMLIALAMAWYYYGWSLVVILILVYLSISLYWITGIFKRMEKRLEDGDNINEIIKDMTKNG